jgi:hypothetical protein
VLSEGITRKGNGLIIGVRASTVAAQQTGGQPPAQKSTIYDAREDCDSA